MTVNYGFSFLTYNSVIKSILAASVVLFLTTQERNRIKPKIVQAIKRITSLNFCFVAIFFSALVSKNINIVILNFFVNDFKPIVSKVLGYTSDTPLIIVLVLFRRELTGSILSFTHAPFLMLS